ncbi:unnamed protein product, partial [Rotaria sordida]
MPEQAAILYSRFMDSNFVKRLTQLMILDDEDDNDETTLDKTRFAMFKVCASPIWHARQVAIEFVQTMIFCNLFNARPYANRIHDLVFKSLFDEQFEVRIIASTTLSGLYQCDYIQVTKEDLNIPKSGITIISAFPHAHLQGRSIWTKIIRNKKAVQYLFNSESCDFHYQFQNRFTEPIKLYPGDEFATRCVYNTMNKTILINGQRYPSDGRGLCLCKCCKGKDCYATETKGSFALINGNRCYDSKYACIS